MLEKNLKARIPVITKPIPKKTSSFVSGKPGSPKKMVTNKDAYKRQ